MIEAKQKTNTVNKWEYIFKVTLQIKNNPKNKVNNNNGTELIPSGLHFHITIIGRENVKAIAPVACGFDIYADIECPNPHSSSIPL